METKILDSINIVITPHKPKIPATMLTSIHNAINGDDALPEPIMSVAAVNVSNKYTINAIKKIFFLGVQAYVIAQIIAVMPDATSVGIVINVDSVAFWIIP
jgi:hypothetical protein